MQFHCSSTMYCKKKCKEWMLLLIQNIFCLHLTLCIALKIHLLQIKKSYISVFNTYTFQRAAYTNFSVHCESCSNILCTSVLKSCLTRLCSVRVTLLPLYCVLQRLGLQHASDILSWQHLPTVGWDSSSRGWPCQHEPIWPSGFTEPEVSHSPS